MGRTNNGCGGVRAVRIASPAIAPSLSRTTAHHSGQSVGAGSPAARRSRYRLVTVATTVVTTGSAARWASAAARKAAGSVVSSTS